MIINNNRYIMAESVSDFVEDRRTLIGRVSDVYQLENLEIGNMPTFQSPQYLQTICTR